MNSSDDGNTWTEPISVPCLTCKGGSFRTAGLGDIVPGDSRGLCILNTSIKSGRRLVSPTWSGTQYSDDGGHTWALHPAESGENAIARWWKGGYIQTR
jgi:hypothetical protein